jgi:hypothetical protein
MAKHRSLLSPTQLLTRLAEQRPLWEPLITFDPGSRHYVRLAATSGVVPWLPGRGTEWHNHGGSAGAFLTVRGALTERQAMVQRDGPPRVRPDVRTIHTGMPRPFGTKHIHRVTNEGPEAAVSLHVYAPALVEMNEYAVDGGRPMWWAGTRPGGTPECRCGLARPPLRELLTAWRSWASLKPPAGGAEPVSDLSPPVTSAHTGRQNTIDVLDSAGD